MGSVSRRLRRNQVKKFMQDKQMPFFGKDAKGKKVNHLKKWFDSVRSGKATPFFKWKQPFESVCVKRESALDAKKVKRYQREVVK